jgi:hypothetical protein
MMPLRPQLLMLHNEGLHYMNNQSCYILLLQNFPHDTTGIQCLILRCCNISDIGLEAIMELILGPYKLEIAGCNEITEQGLWSGLHPTLASLYHH